MKIKKSNAGQSILLLVIFIVTLLIIFAIRGLRLVEIEQSIVERSRLERSAENAFQNVTQKAIWLLEQDARLEKEAKERDENYEASDSYFDNWSKKGPEAPHNESKLVIRWRIADAHSRFNINSLLNVSTGKVDTKDRDRYQAFLQNLRIKEPEKLTASLADWLDAKPAEGAEADPNDNNEYEQGAKNAPLLALSEMRMLPGHTSELLTTGTEDSKIGLYSCLTVVPHTQLNANTAEAHVIMLAHEDMTASLAGRIVSGRQSDPYLNVGEVMRAAGEPDDSFLYPLFTVQSMFFILEMEADFQGITEKKRVFLRRTGTTVSVERVENIGLFTWDEDLMEKMDDGVEKLIESLGQ